MGSWAIKILGVGCHHNMSRPDLRPSDADFLTKEFVKLLKAHGHHVIAADFQLISGHEDIKEALRAEKEPKEYGDTEDIDPLDPSGAESAIARLRHRMHEFLDKAGMKLVGEPAVSIVPSMDLHKGQVATLKYKAA